MCSPDSSLRIVVLLVCLDGCCNNLLCDVKALYYFIFFPISLAARNLSVVKGIAGLSSYAGEKHKMLMS